tara:strand:- start:205 stop:1638 length:1434 start_codon:yes stop_codon:yes gene_type:complete
MATTKVRGEVVDFNPGNPDYILDSTNAVTVINAGGNQYNFNGVYGKFGAKIGTITLTGVPSSHPFALINNGKTSQISYTGTVDEGTAVGPDGNTYTFYSGTVTLTVSADFGIISYYCKIHGYMGGQDNLVYTYSDSGLKMPSGTDVREGADTTGKIRNNTSDSSEASQSCMEYYNGTEWKTLTNTPPPQLNYVIIAGGGTGGRSGTTTNAFYPSGGGGAGGFRTTFGTTSGGGCSAESTINLEANTFTVTIGAGGNPGSASATGYGSGGSDSTLAYASTTVTTVGGGGGNGPQWGNSDGGSGGGGGGGVYQSPGSGTACQGYGAGSMSSSWCGSYTGAGGGGAGGTNSQANGGPGISNSITGAAVDYAGGGGGGTMANTTSCHGTGGTGGGGTGGYGTGTYSGVAGTDGTVNTGSGGGGSGNYAINGAICGAGGSGLVILRLPTASYTGTVTGSPTVTTDGTDTIMKFTGSGTYVQT